MSKGANTIGSIAIVGMAGRFPGAPDVDAFWRNLRDGIESITFLSDEELLADGADPSALRDPNYIKARGLIEGPDLFDAAFFGYTPREAEAMDPQHRIFLETAAHALENAGYDAEQYRGAIGVYAGLYTSTYLLANLVSDRAYIGRLLSFSSPGAFQTVLGNDKDYITSRVAYKLNLRGPAVTIQTACSTSLVAVAQACQSLLSYGCDLALAGGVAINFPFKKGYHYEEGGMLSPDGHCRAFDAQAQGTVFGNGAGLVALKRLEDALADGDTIHAVIRGSALNNDGSNKVSFTAPSIDGQAEVIALAQAVAGVTADTITYVEAHGTGTPLGDPIEIAALTQAFRETTDKTGFCAIGAVKTNVGHLDAAAGITGLLKTTLALKHAQLPPTLHFTAPNPKIDFASSPFVVNTALRPWDRLNGEPRRAGVSSFGVGGTNAHVVLEEAPELPATTVSQRPQLLLLSAKSEAALERATANLASFLEKHANVNLADVAHTLRIGRRAFPCRRTVVCRDHSEAVDAIEVLDPKKVASANTPAGERRVAFLFPGQGAQSVNMGRALYEAEPVFRRELDRCAELLLPLLGCDLREVIYPARGDEAAATERLKETRFTQPALFAVEWALAQLWLSWGVKPQAMIGHSVGEYVAACLAEVIPLEDALTLVATRARLVQAQPPGAMLAVRLPESDLLPRIPAALSLAAVNSPKLCVVAGPHDAIAAFEQALASDGIVSRYLSTSHAFHSAMMDNVIAPFTEAVRRVALREPKLPFVSCVSGTWITAAEATSPEYWARHLRKPVRFADAVATLCDGEDAVLLEVGPGTTLATLARQHPSRGERVIAASLPSAEDEAAGFHRTVGALWLAGVAFDWSAYVAPETRRRVPLPAYPFERKRFWVEPPKAQPLSRAQVLVEALPAPIDQTIAPSEASPSAASRADRIFADMCAMLLDMSGIAIGEKEARSTFVELGFDSLFLTQARQAFLTRFGVKVTFRQLLEEVTTPRALADYFDAQMPGDAPSAQAATPKAATPIALAAPIATPLAAKPPETKIFGPFRPINKAADGGLTPRQQAHLAELIARFTRHTATSKKLTAEFRAKVADPRSVANFRQLWKELIYQIVIERADGAYLWDVDGHRYIDYTMGFGVNLFGHGPAWVREAVGAQLQQSVAIGPQSPLVGEVAALISEFTGHERVSFCNTGSEAVMAAMRVARAVTGRTKIVFFSGDYHGMFDEVLLRPNNTTGKLRSLPVAPGIPNSAGNEIYVLEYGAPESLELIRAHAHELAAVLVEPVQSRHPDLVPIEFLRELRTITAETGVKLIMDEVISGFRMHPGGCQALFGVQADMATYGKVIGGGIPIGVLAGKAECMDALDGGAWQFGDDSNPEADMTFFAGTFVRHPLALAAARAVLIHLKERGPTLQSRLGEMITRFAEDANAFFTSEGVPIRILHFGSLFRLAVAPELTHAHLFYFHLLERGIYIRDAGQNCFLSTAHTQADIEALLAAVKESVREMQDGEFFPRGQVQSVLAPNEFPLTAAQQEVWIASQISAEASCSFNESFTATLRGTLNVEAMRAAVNAVITRHEALRTTFSGDGSTQRVNTAFKLELPLLDWTNDPRRFDRLIAQETSTAFDLEKGPLIRAHLVRLKPDEHRLVVTAHHLVFDGWSGNVFLEELRAFYLAQPDSTAPALELATPFRAYAAWETAVVASDEGRAAHAYWKNVHASPAPALELPADHARAAQRSFRGAHTALDLSAGESGSLKGFSAQQNSTLFSTLLSAFATLLHRLTGQDDLVIGIPVAGQNAMGRDALIGHCANVLPLRLRIDANAPFTDLLKASRPAVLDAFEHQTLSFGQLLSELPLDRDPAHPPLLAVTFNFDPPVALPECGELRIEAAPNPRQHFQFDLAFNLVGVGDGLSIECDYNSDLFDATTIARWLGHYRTLLRSICADAANKVSQLPILESSERQRMLGEWNKTDAPLPDAPVWKLIAAQAARTPDAIAAECESRHLSYRELDAAASALAARLQGCGAAPGQLIGICVERSTEMLIAVLGVWKTGAAYVPLDPSFPPARLAGMIEDAAVPLIITDPAAAASLPVHSAQVVYLDERVAAPAPLSPIPVSLEDRAYLLFTSGSTGRPKGVEISHRGLANFLFSMRREPGLTSSDTVLAVTTLSFDIAALELFLPLVIGGKVVIATRDTAADANRLRAELERSSATVMQATPATWRALLATGWNGARILRALIGGEAVPADLVAQLLPRVRELWNMYGPTETTIWSTAERLTSAEPPISIGRPIANTQAYILNPALEPQPIGVVGELHLGGAGLALGYLGQPELTAEKFIPNPFAPGERLYKTGDLARFLPDGRLECLGRLDGQVKVRGFRIERGEIETALCHHPSVAQAAVVVRRSGDGDERLVAYCTPRNGAIGDEFELRRHLATRLPGYMVPNAFVALARLPLTANGKVDLKALPDLAADAVTQREVAPAETALQAELIALWEEMLERRPIGIHDSFFDVGGHSLLAMRLLTRIRDQWKVTVPLRRLFEAPTLAEVAAAIESGSTHEEAPPAPRIVPVVRRHREGVRVAP